jgi:uncharacterized repeat protein (TIGR01451 family)
VHSWNSPWAIVIYGRFALAIVAAATGGTASLPVRAQTPDLIVQLERSGEIVLPVFTGRTATYNVTVINIGDAAAPHVFVITTLPLSWSFDATSDCFFTPAGYTSGRAFPFPRLPRPARALCDLGQLAAGASERFQLIARAPHNLVSPSESAIDSKIFTISSVVDPDNLVPESNENNNGASIETEVLTAADLLADWTSDAPPAQFGIPLHYHARVLNKGDREAQDVTAAIDLPAVILVDQFDGGDLHCTTPVVIPTSGNSRATCTVSVIAAGGEATTKFTAHLSPAITTISSLNLVVTADPFSAVMDRDRSNNSAAILVTVPPLADLKISGTLTATDHWSDPFQYLFGPSYITTAYDGMTVVNLSVHVHNAGPAVSAPTSLQLDWAPGFMDQDSPCPANTIVNSAGACVEATRDPPVCFDSAPVPSLPAGRTVDIDCAAMVKFDPFGLSHFVLWGTATLDPNNAELDPNRQNNQMTLPNHAGSVAPL